MEFDVRNRELRFSIFGLEDPRHPEGFIAADIFARKVREILAALKVADKSVNARTAHQYVVSDLKISSAEVGPLERQLVRMELRSRRLPHSLIAGKPSIVEILVRHRDIITTLLRRLSAYRRVLEMPSLILIFVLTKFQ